MQLVVWKHLAANVVFIVGGTSDHGSCHSNTTDNWTDGKMGKIPQKQAAMARRRASKANRGATTATTCRTGSRLRIAGRTITPAVKTH